MRVAGLLQLESGLSGGGVFPMDGEGKNLFSRAVIVKKLLVELSVFVKITGDLYVFQAIGLQLIHLSLLKVSNRIQAGTDLSPT